MTNDTPIRIDPTITPATPPVEQSGDIAFICADADCMKFLHQHAEPNLLIDLQEMIAVDQRLFWRENNLRPENNEAWKITVTQPVYARRQLRDESGQGLKLPLDVQTISFLIYSFYNPNNGEARTYPKALVIDPTTHRYISINGACPVDVEEEHNG